MLNIRKRFFLLLTIIGLMFVVTSCNTSTDYVKVTFDSNTYEVKVGQTLDIEPLISKGSSVGVVTIEYSSYDDSIATYVNGKLTGVQPGEVVIKVVCNEKPVAYDTATVYVVADDLPEVEFGSIPEKIYKGEEIVLTYSFIPEYAEATVEFLSANPDVAVVDENGVITGTGMGTAVISVRVTDVYGQYRDYNFSIIVEPADYTIEYDLDGGTNNPDNHSGYNTLTLPVNLLAPTKEGYKFLGWYSGDELVETIEQGTEGNISVKAKWELVEYSINYDFAGGNNGKDVYKTREEMVDDFLTDAMATYKVTTKPTSMLDFATKFDSAITAVFTNETTAEKWTWLKNYIIEVTSVDNTKTQLIAGSETFWRYSLGAFLFQEHRVSWPASEDFTNEEKANGFWEVLKGVGATYYNVHSEEFAITQEAFRSGYKFLGWYNGDELVEKIPAGSTGDLTLVAKWEIIEYSVQLEGVPTVKYLYETREEMIADFVADFKATTGVELKTSVTANGVAGSNANQKAFWDNDEMFAKWGWLARYLLDTVTAHGKNGVHFEQKAQYEDILNRVDRSAEGSYSWWALRRDVYGFVAGFDNGWYTANGKVDWSKEEFNNGFWDYAKDSNYVVPQTTFRYTIETGLELPTLTYGNWEFLGWYSGDQKVETITLGTTGDITLTAKWYKPNEQFAINYELAEGVLPKDAATSFVAKNGLAELPTPTKIGYTFKGWFLDAECTKVVTAIEAGVATADVTLYASWELDTYTIDYELNGGEFQTDKVVSLYDSFEDLATDFINDYSIMFGLSNVTAATFYGKSSQYGVYTFFANENMAEKWGWLLDFISEQSQTTNYAGKSSLNLNAGVANFNKYMRVNLAAFLQETRLNNLSPASMDFTNVDGETLWAACPTQEIKVGIEAKDSYTVLDLPLQLASPFKEGATFEGWYLNENLKEGKVETITEELIGNVKLYARWSDSVISFDTYTIEYVLGGGELSKDAPTTYVEEQGAKLLDATRAGYTFKGWFLDAECTQSVTEFTTTDKGDKIVYACWETIEYSVTFEVGNGKLPTVSQAVGDYVDFDAVVAELVKDIQTIKGSTYTLQYFIDYTSSGYNVFAGTQGSTTFFANADMRAKWSWLITYAKLNREAAGLDIAQYDKLLNDGYVDTDSATINVELIAFIKGQQYSYKVSDTLTYGSSDYSQAEIQNKVWEYVEKVHYVEIVADIKFTVEDLPLQLPEPSPAEGEVFYGWYLNEEFTGEPIFSIPANTTNDVTVYAKYVAENTELKYAINYEVNGGVLSEGAATEYVNGTALPISATATKLGFTFAGWYLDAALTQAVTEISTEQKGDITLYAKWEANAKHTITYVLADGTLLEGAPTEFVEGVGATLVGAMKEYHTFGGWYLNAECTGEAVTSISADTKEDVTLYARWISLESKSITYEVNGGTLPTDAPTIYYVGLGLELNVTPTREGYKFLGWYLNAECTGEAVTSISADTKEDVTLYALWQDLSQTYNVTYNLNGGNILYQTRDELVADFLSDISTISGVEITAGNFRTSARQTQFTALLADDALWAKWEWLFKFISSINENPNAPALYEEVLTKRTCTSENWWFLTRDFDGFVNKNLGNFYYSTAAIDFTLYANGDGFWDQIQTQYVDSKALSLVTPYRPYYTFEGWYTNAEFTGNPVTTFSSDCTLYAKWSKQTVKLTYTLNNEKASLATAEVVLHASDSVAELPTPTFDAALWVFNGWYLNAECTEKVTKIDEYQTSDITLYASWTELEGNEYNITYVLNEGNWNFSTRDEVVVTFLADFATVTGNTVAADGLYAIGNIYGTFYDDDEMFAKWSWLIQYFYDLGTQNYGYHAESQSQYQTFLAGNGTTVSSQWAVRQNTQGFMTMTKCGKYSGTAAIDFSVVSLANGFWSTLNASQQTVFANNKGTTTLQTPKRAYYKFGGWYTNAEFTGDPVTTVDGETTVYAKWEEEVPVDSVVITNKVEEMKRFATHQLTWEIKPDDAVIKDVVFSSSDTSVATVDENGLVTAVGTGTVTIKMTSLSPTGKTDEFSFNVYDPDHFEISYATESYVTVDKQIKLLAEWVKRDGSTVSVVWSTLDSEVATVDGYGIVTGVNPGVATIRAQLSTNSEVYIDFIVTVLDSNLSSALQHVVDSHESNVFVKYNLGIGAGTPEYYSDIFGSVSKLLYNHSLTIDDKYLESGNATNAYYKNSTINEGLYFITVHYTGTMGTTADTDNIAANFTREGTNVSIHYVTGNVGTYSDGTPSSDVFHTLDHANGAYHAGDSGAYTHSNFPGAFDWYPTGVAYDDVDLLEVKFTASDDFYYEINGKKTIIPLPKTWNYQSSGQYRNTDHIYNADGTITSQPDFTLTWASFSNRTPESFFNDQGFPITVINGEYYMGPTWWSYGQVAEGRICGSGGNRNSIGIESCVNKGSDLWYTWQVTAQLVAKLMLDNDLDISRVKGHHFFDGKDCPQPLLENDLEIWWEFIDLVKAEYELLTTFKDAKFEMELLRDYDFVSEYGRIIEQPEYSQIVSYTVSVQVGDKIETITLATAVNGIYTK